MNARNVRSTQNMPNAEDAQDVRKSEENVRKGILKGIRIVDMTQFVSGPYCSQLLGDLGAEVIKIERPPSGDAYRKTGPIFLNGESSTFLCLNRNKKSLAVDAKDPRGLEVVKKLVRTSDVFLENSRPGAMAKMGLGFDDLIEENPRLIYCSISGYGQTGPYRERGGFDLILQGEGGIMSVTGPEDGPPVKVGVPILDIGAALLAAVGILASYIEVSRTGKGKHVDTSLLDFSVASLTTLLGNYLQGGEVPRRMGSASPLFAPYQAFRTKDIYITAAGAPSDDLWRRFCRAIGRDDLTEDERFRDNAGRVRNQRALASAIEETLVTKPAAFWLERFEEQGVPAGPINDLTLLADDPQVTARSLIVRIEHPVAGEIKEAGLPLRITEKGGAESSMARKPPARLGEHTEEIMSSLGYSREEIEDLVKDGVVAKWPPTTPSNR